MKRMILITLLLSAIGAAGLRAQTSYSCHYREYCDWNDVDDKFENCEGYDEASLFVMNKDETMFSHTIETMKSTYYVQKKEYDAENDVYTYDVVSDVGNKYFYIFDTKNKEIRAVFTKDDQIRLVRFYIKAVF